MNAVDMPEHSKIEEFTERVKAYMDVQLELFKLEMTERFSIVLSGMISGLLVGFVLVLFLLFISFWAGFYLSARMGNTYTGFAIVAGFYFLIGLVLIVGRKNIVERPIRNNVIRSVFSKHK